MATGLLIDKAFERHVAGPGHPESPARLRGIAEELERRAFRDDLIGIEPRSATLGELGLVHAPDYLELVEEEIRAGRPVLSTGDTYVCEASFDVARRASGGVLRAIDAVFDREVTNAFCAVRPPGHHATAERGMGFCVVNHVAVAARYAQEKFGVERVAIIDWDVHHGNGTQDIFYEDGSVFYFSTHQSPWYPGTGAREERGAGGGENTTLNVPLPAGTGMEAIDASFVEEFEPAMEDFGPDLVLISAGFDSRVGDPLGNFRLEDKDFAALTRRLLDLAHRQCEDRVVAVLEGGYNVSGLASAVAAHVETLMGR